MIETIIIDVSIRIVFLSFS